jgi:hypothetical protein
MTQRKRDLFLVEIAILQRQQDFFGLDLGDTVRAGGDLMRDARSFAEAGFSASTPKLVLDRRPAMATSMQPRTRERAYPPIRSAAALRPKASRSTSDPDP